MPKYTEKKDLKILKSYGQDCNKTTINIPIYLLEWIEKEIKDAHLTIPRNAGIIMYLEKCRKEGIKII